MTPKDREKRLREILPKEKGLSRCNRGASLKEISAYNQALSDCLTALKDKVILREELLGVEEIKKIAINKMSGRSLFYDMLQIIEDIAQAIHNAQKKRLEGG